MKAKTDLYCPRCGTKIHKKGDELRSLIFPRQEQRCSQCSTMLRRRTGGGQHNPWNFVTSRLECLKKEMNRLKYSITETDRKWQEFLDDGTDLKELSDKVDELIRDLESKAKEAES